MLKLSEEQFAAINRRIEQSAKKVNGRYGLNAPETPTARPEAQPKAKPAKQRREAPAARESQVMEAVAGILDRHPLVDKFWRQNTGAAKFDQYYVKFGFRGCSDYLGFLTDGRILAVECKATGKTPTFEQQSFLDSVERAGGFACWTDDGVNLLEKLEKWRKSHALPRLQR